MSVKTNRKTYRRSRHYTQIGPTGAVLADQIRTESTWATDYVDTGDNIKSWRLLKSLGQGVTTRLTARKTTARVLGAFYQATGARVSNQKERITTTGLLPVTQVPSQIVTGDSSTEARAASAYVEKAREEIAAFQGGTFFAELLEAIRMFTRPAEGLYKKTAAYATKLKRARHVYYVDRESYSRMVSSSWLKYQFGIKPLASDLVSASIALDRLYSEGGFRITKKVMSSAESETILGQEVNQSVVDCTYAVRNRIRSSRTRVKYYGTVVTRPSMAGFPLQEFGMASHDILPTIWEMIPWSFALDYFANFGDIIEATSFCAANVGWTARGTRVDHIHKYSALKVSNNPDANGPNRWYNVECRGGSEVLMTSVLSRTPSSFPIPVFSFRMPGFESPKWLNLAALAQLVASSDPRTLR